MDLEHNAALVAKKTAVVASRRDLSRISGILQAQEASGDTRSTKLPATATARTYIHSQNDGESSGQGPIKTSSVSSPSTVLTLSSTIGSVNGSVHRFESVGHLRADSGKPATTSGSKKRKQFEDNEEARLSSRKERFGAMDPSYFWKLRSGRTVEEILYLSSLKMDANFKMRSYTIDFDCERTKAVFTDDEWSEMEELNDFQLPKLPESTERYLRDVRKALVKGEHVASVPVPEEDRYSCELLLRAFLSWKQLYISKPCPFGNKDLSESFWCHEAWPIMKGLLADVDGLTMIDGEKAGLESGKRKNTGRKADTETPTPRKQAGRKVDLVARDTVNSRDWFIVESLKEWDEVSTKFLRELDVTLLKDLHLIASIAYRSSHMSDSTDKHDFSQYTLEACATVTVKMYEACLNEEIEDDSEGEEEDASDGEWLYKSSRRNIFDETLGSSPLDSASSAFYS